MSKTQAILLKEEDQARVNYLVINFGRTEANLLKFSELMMLLLDRCMFSNKFTLGQFYTIFEASQKIPTKIEKDSLQGERIVNRDQLVFIFNEIAKILFKLDPNYQTRFYSVFLSEGTVSDNDEINRSRIMVFDDSNKKILVEESIRKIVRYENELHHIFVAYMVENYFSIKKARRFLLSVREILLQNKKWSFTSLILFLKESETTPHLINIEHIQEYMRMIIPNTNSRQQEFYSKHVMTDCYQKQNQIYQETTHPGDPGIMFFQFQLLLLRIAWESYPKEMERKSIQDVIDRYFRYLCIRTNQDLNTLPLPNFNRKLIIKMKQYYSIIKQQNKIQKAIVIPQQLYSPSQMLAKKIEQLVINAPDIGFDFKDAFKILDRQLPKLPPLPKVVPENPPPFSKDNVITIGMQPPPQPVDKNDKPSKPQKKDAGKKDQPPPRQFKWAQMPSIKYVSEDFLKDVQTKLNFQVQPLTSLNRGTLKKQVYPVLISEVLFPPQLPKSVIPYIKSASNALSDRNYILALENYANGLAEWKKTSVDIEAQTQLFFQYSKGSVYLSAGKLEYALNIFYNCKKFCDTSRLPFSNPDRSLAYFGLGEVLYEMEQFQLSARCFLKSREVREAVLGLQHVQTATTFNNLGCCFYMLSRPHQALGYIQIAEVVLDTELGPHHQRTMTARSNLKKISHGTYKNQPEYRKLWEVFQEDKFEKKKKKKKEEGKKK